MDHTFCTGTGEPWAQLTAACSRDICQVQDAESLDVLVWARNWPGRSFSRRRGGQHGHGARGPRHADRGSQRRGSRRRSPASCCGTGCSRPWKNSAGRAASADGTPSGSTRWTRPSRRCFKRPGGRTLCVRAPGISERLARLGALRRHVAPRPRHEDAAPGAGRTAHRREGPRNHEDLRDVKRRLRGFSPHRDSRGLGSGISRLQVVRDLPAEPGGVGRLPDVFLAAGQARVICAKAAGVFMYAKEVLSRLDSNAWIERSPERLAELYMSRYEKTSPRATPWTSLRPTPNQCCSCSWRRGRLFRRDWWKDPSGRRPNRPRRFETRRSETLGKSISRL